MTAFNFDEIIDRSGHHSAKWGAVAEGCLPMWVADMDFRSPPAAIDAMIERARHGVFGYTLDPPQLKEAVVERMERLYNWRIRPEDVLFSPGLVLALCATCSGFGKPGDTVLIQTPVYGSFFKAIRANRKLVGNIEMEYIADDAHSFHYENDYDIFEMIARDPRASIHLQCNPQNPAGFVYSPSELERVAEICLRHKLLIVADEIHSDLILEGEHIPIAALSEEIAQSTLTMIAPSKTFNLAGMACSVLIAQNKEIRETMAAALQSISAHVNIMGYEAAYGAYTGGEEWLRQLLLYLKDNRDFAIDYIRQHLPQIKTTIPTSTYLLWMDMRDLPIDGDLITFCQETAGVALTPGPFFGDAFDGFVRLNFGCPRATLLQGLERLRAAVDQLALPV
ncbi:MAG: pyridoxal phosphate-dependent aminotransferase [Chloroflexota bacterium]|nr:pyridoxal phosphate-dependent aminotransferase [Chloroflexota bacterium]MDE2948509.1 pyridoxal phosphate-dependent aminotransferase [Chloroflexota bacterium]